MRKIVALFALAPLFGCAPTTPGTTTGNPTSPTSPTSPTDPSCVDPSGCKSDNPAPTCGAQTFALGSTKIAPNIYFIVDASGSMAADDFGDFDPTKWDAAQTALTSVVDAHVGQAQWGLSIFPKQGFDYCAPGQVDVAIAAGNDAAIKAKINGVSANDVYDNDGATPTSSTMLAAASVAGLKDGTRPNYIVLMTDGEPNCESSSDPGRPAAPDRTVNAIKALAAATPPVKTFVVGLGDVNNSDPTALNDFADAGGTARAGSVHYYPAANATDLQAAFNQIVQGVASCDYHLDMPPADPTLVAPTFDGHSVAQNSANGFTYDGTTQTVTFHGTTCDQLKSGTVMSVAFVYGCPPTGVL